MIARRRFLLEGVLVLLVDDDQAELARRGEDGTASANDDLRLYWQIRRARVWNAVLLVGGLTLADWLDAPWLAALVVLAGASAGMYGIPYAVAWGAGRRMQRAFDRGRPA